MPSADDIRTSVLVYSAIVSTIAIIWNIVRDVRNRPSLIVRGALDSVWFMSGMDSPRLRIDVTNSSQRPVTVTAVGWKATSTKDFIPFPSQALGRSDCLPKTLNESELHSVMVQPTYIGNNPDQVEYLFAKDSTGKAYKSKRMPLQASVK